MVKTRHMQRVKWEVRVRCNTQLRRCEEPIPTEYSSLRSNLLLQDKLDKEIIRSAFQSEEINHRSDSAPSPFPVNSALAASSPCHFCGEIGHFQTDCNDYKRQKEWVKKNKGGRQKGYAKKAQESSEVSSPSSGNTELASNASLRIFDPSDPLCPLQVDAHSDWTVDTGATSHMTPHRHWLRDYKPYRVPIKLADRTVIYSVGIGSVVFYPEVEGRKMRSVTFSRVLHVPDLQNNLLAVLYLTRKNGYIVHITHSTIDFLKDGQLRFAAPIDDSNTAFLSGTTCTLSEYANFTATVPFDVTLWHRRLGHPNHAHVKSLFDKQLVTGMRIDSNTPLDPVCEPCLSGKMHAYPFVPSEHRSTQFLELIHSDLHGPLPLRTHSGFRYWITFIDDYS